MIGTALREIPCVFIWHGLGFRLGHRGWHGGRTIRGAGRGLILYGCRRLDNRFGRHPAAGIFTLRVTFCPEIYAAGDGVGGLLLQLSWYWTDDC